MRWKGTITDYTEKPIPYNEGGKKDIYHSPRPYNKDGK